MYKRKARDGGSRDSHNMPPAKAHRSSKKIDNPLKEVVDLSKLEYIPPRGYLPLQRVKGSSIMENFEDPEIETWIMRSSKKVPGEDLKNALLTALESDDTASISGDKCIGTKFDLDGNRGNSTYMITDLESKTAFAEVNGIYFALPNNEGQYMFSKPIISKYMSVELSVNDRKSLKKTKKTHIQRGRGYEK